MEIDYSGQVVLITGGAKGVGAGISETFLAAGAAVEVCGRNRPEDLPSVDTNSVVFREVDVRDEDQVAAWVADVVERHGRIDVAVNNAGGAPFAYFAEASPRFHRRVTELNFFGALFLSHAVHPIMAAQETGGVVLNITSISARRASPGTAVYGAAKAALENLTSSLAVEWAPKVRVNAISCGLVATPGAVDHYGDQAQFEAVARTIPAGRFASPADIGAACAMLASQYSRHITGAVLDVDGGGEWPAFLEHTPNFVRPS